MSEKFLVDSNFWITCANALYPQRHFPSFWAAMETYLADGTILHHWSVDEELHRKKDGIAAWLDGLANDGKLTVINRPRDTPESYIEVCSWPLSCDRPHAKPYTRAAISVFQDATRADAWLCAQAMESGYTLVTREKPEPQAYKAIKIPDVCEGLGISCLNFMDFFDAIDLVV